MADAITALASLRITWVVDGDDVWRLDPDHVEGIHRGVENAITRGIDDAEASDSTSPIGLILQGQKGVGKTETLSWAREQAYRRGGYFFLVSLLDGQSFWTSVVHSMNQGLLRIAGGGETQLKQFLTRLGELIDAPARVRSAVTGAAPLTVEILDEFVELLQQHDMLVGSECRDTARALVLLCSDDTGHRDIGDTYLQGDEIEPAERIEWGFRAAPLSAERVVQDLSWLLALTGPSVIAIDQIDALVAQSVKELDDTGTVHPGQDVMLERIAGGLMTLWERTRRTLTLVACIPDSWILLRDRTTNTVQDRFRQPKHLMTISDTELARELVRKRFATKFAAIGFTPPYPTWPVRESAFAGTLGFTPRELLKAIHAHVDECLDRDQVRELETFAEVSPAGPAPGTRVPPAAAAPDLHDLDTRYELLQREEAAVASVLAEAREDFEIPELLRAGLKAWALSRGAAGRALEVDPPPGKDRPPIHARLRLTLDERVEDEMHWAFRAIAATHHSAALSRIRKAATDVGLVPGSSKRRLFLLRNSGWNQGPATRRALEALEQAGGGLLQVAAADLLRLHALRSILQADHDGLHAWLTARRPADEIDLFRQALADVDDLLEAAEAAPEPAPEPASSPRQQEHGQPGYGQPGYGRQETQETAGPSIVLGTVAGAEASRAVELRVGLESLRKHMAIFAGSGSGKTVLIRRLVEECALQGVSAIVLDPNNDLARLGDPWPQPPAGWGAGDAERAAEYLAGTDVVVWTPGRESGRPLTLQPLPDFAAVRGDPDEFAEAVQAAVAALIPRAGIEGRAGRAHLKQAVLRNAVDHYGRAGGSRLDGLIELLRELPAPVSPLDDAEKLAFELAQALTAAMVNDRLFGGSGVPMDPGLLLTPAPGKRARVSVISFVGLPSEGERQSFVNQLQMALFAWIKRHPAGERPLGGLLVMDEAQTLAPSGPTTPCTQSTLALASQARKYGLGLVFATQAPKGLHNRIPGNTTTQFFGLLNAPVQIAAAREMAQAKGGDVPGISLLSTGEFYAATEGAPFAKVQTPLCLSYHPQSPLTMEEVLARARA